MAGVRVPLAVMVPELVTGPPVNDRPVVPPETFTLLTDPVALIVMDPAPLVIEEILVPAVSVASA